MSYTSYNFKDNLTIDNNKYLKWLNSSGLTRASILGLDNNNNLNINSASADIYINSNITRSSITFFNVNSTIGNDVIVNSKLGIGFQTTDLSANLTLVNNGYIGVKVTTGTANGYLGLSGSHSLLNSDSSRILLYSVLNFKIIKIMKQFK